MMHMDSLPSTSVQRALLLDSLPSHPRLGHRYASFKLFYTDDTPDDYQPPHFQAGDVLKDKWYFTTHALNEAPDTWDIGKLYTGHHL